MVIIDKEKCIGCGLCVKDCFGDAMRMGEKAEYVATKCMECGHCVAVCPQNAITIEGLDMTEVLDLKDICGEIDPENYLNHLKERRTIRAFKDTPVTDKQLEMILEAGRFSPTGSNLQNVAYHVFRKDLGVLREKEFDALKKMGEDMLSGKIPAFPWASKWIRMYDEFHGEGKDQLFFDCDTVIVISSSSAQAACIAGAHMETMIYSLGLGMIYSGFSTRVINAVPEVREFVGLQEGYDAWMVLGIGTPDVKYRRTVPRKKVNVTWR